MPIFSAN